MTNQLTITREQLTEWVAQLDCDGGCDATDKQLEALIRQSLAAMDSEPVAWQIHTPETGVTYVETKPQSVENIRNGFGIKVEIAPLYRHAQQPVVPEEKPMPNTLSMYAVDAVAAIAEVKGWNACRAAMLNHPSSIQPNTDAAPSTEIKHPSSNSPVIGIDLASGPDRTVEVRYVAPPGYVMVPKEPTETMINAWLSEVANWRGHVAGYKAMLAVAPQEVK